MNIELVGRAALYSVPALVIVFGAFRLIKAYFHTPPPSGPASLGRALGFLTLGEILGAVTIGYLCHLWAFVAVEEMIGFIRFASTTLVFVLVTSGAGYLAARSYEDVGAMNAKIFIVIGFFLHSLISSIAFMRSGYVLLMILSFIPCCMFGSFVQLKIHSKSSPASAQLSCAPERN